MLMICPKRFLISTDHLINAGVKTVNTSEGRPQSVAKERKIDENDWREKENLATTIMKWI